MSEIRLRERRATLLCTLYALAAWGLYVAVWYLGLLAPTRGGREFSGRGHDRVQEAVRAIPVFIGPVVSVLLSPFFFVWRNLVNIFHAACFSCVALFNGGTTALKLQKVRTCFSYSVIISHRCLQRRRCASWLRNKGPRLKKSRKKLITTPLAISWTVTTPHQVLPVPE